MLHLQPFSMPLVFHQGYKPLPYLIEDPQPWIRRSIPGMENRSSRHSRPPQHFRCQWYCESGSGSICRARSPAPSLPRHLLSPDTSGWQHHRGKEEKKDERCHQLPARLKLNYRNFLHLLILHQKKHQPLLMASNLYLAGSSAPQPHRLPPYKPPELPSAGHHRAAGHPQPHRNPQKHWHQALPSNDCYNPKLMQL